MKFRTLLVISVFSTLIRALAAPVPLRLEPSGAPHPAFQTNKDHVEIQGAQSIRALPARPPAATDTVIEFEYFCVGGVPSISVLTGPPFQEASSRQLPALGHSETWSTYASRLATGKSPLPGDWKELRIDLPLPADRTLQLRNARLRPERPGEFDPIKAKPSASSSKEELETYLTKIFPCSITKVSVGKNSVRIEGNTSGMDGDIHLADIPMDHLLNDKRNGQTLVKPTIKSNGTFMTDVPRRRDRNGRDHDRLTSRWQLVRKTPEGIEPLSHARYPGWVDCRAPNLPAIRPANKKGLGGWHTGRLPNELVDLGITAVTVNVMVNSLISINPAPGTIPIQWMGKTYHIREKALAKYDQSFREARKHKAMVSVILLLANPAKSADPTVRMMGHPDALKEGTYAMPNVTSANGIGLYGAILNFMAERWTRPDAKFGRVHHWIIHNEVDAGWVWTNVGEKPDIVYMDLYQRSMRLTDLIVRQYDPHARPFISLTHHWAEAGNKNWYGSKRMLDLLVEFTRAEGDFQWALAYHPYPQSLRNPRTWEDTQATFDFESKKITPMNLEVLDAYMKQAAFLHEGKVRPVHLSENGFNSKDYSPKSLEDQAAGMAFVWKKMAPLTSIESWQYHNWIDNRKEGGLRIGLRKFPDEPGDPLGKKPIWHLYKALGTPMEDKACAPYLKTIGISSWNDAIHQGPIR